MYKYPLTSIFFFFLSINNSNGKSSKGNWGDWRWLQQARAPGSPTDEALRESGLLQNLILVFLPISGRLRIPVTTGLSTRWRREGGLPRVTLNAVHCRRRWGTALHALRGLLPCQSGTPSLQKHLGSTLPWWGSHHSSVLLAFALMTQRSQRPQVALALSGVSWDPSFTRLPIPS